MKKLHTTGLGPLGFLFVIAVFLGAGFWYVKKYPDNPISGYFKKGQEAIQSAEDVRDKLNDRYNNLDLE